MAGREADLRELFIHTLKDIYYAERHILKALPRMQRNATSKALRDAFALHREQTELQVERLDQVFELMGERPRGKTCAAIIGIVDEAKEIIEDFEDTEALDAGLIMAAQAVEHYEITRYGTLKAWAEELELEEVAELLDETLQEEKDTDALLSQIAEGGVNQQAEGEGATSRKASNGRQSRAGTRSTGGAAGGGVTGGENRRPRS